MLNFISRAESKRYITRAQGESKIVMSDPKTYKIAVRRQALCECSYCGSQKIVDEYHARKGNIISCGCLGKLKRFPVIRKHVFDSVEGKKFGKLRVVGPAHADFVWNRAVCECDCGTVKEVKIRDLVKGRSTSCGCKYTKKC